MNATALHPNLAVEVDNASNGYFMAMVEWAEENNGRAFVLVSPFTPGKVYLLGTQQGVTRGFRVVTLAPETYLEIYKVTARIETAAKLRLLASQDAQAEVP